MSEVSDVHVPFGSTEGTVNDGKVTAAKLASNAVTASKIASGAVSNAKLGSDAVTGTKLASSALKLLVFTGKNGSGACTLTGAAVNDEVVGVINLSDLTDDAANFESAITVADEIQQSSESDLSTKKFGVLLVAKS